MKNHTKRYLGKRGYILRKDDLTDAEQKEIRKTFTAKPFIPRGVPQGPGSQPFEVFQENKNKFYLPKEKAISMFGYPDVVKMPSGQDRPNLKFVGSLRDYQLEPVDKLITACKERRGGILSVPGGRGKCMAKGTPLLMANGSIKTIENVQPGDLLMGDANQPRTVLNTCKGHDWMFKVEMPAHQVSYVVNSAHILCLRKEYSNDILEISVADLLQDVQGKYSDYGGYSSPLVKFSAQTTPLPIDPYIMGFWITRGELGTVNKQYKLTILQFCNALKRDHIPPRYRTGSCAERWRLLGGMIDGQSVKCFNSEMNRFEITLPKTLHSDTLFVARSLGYRATVHPGNCIHIEGDKLHRIKTLIKGNRAIATGGTPQDYLFSPITITCVGIDPYFGFMLDGNGRYLLESCTVTHNTVMAIKIMEQLKKKTLVIVHKNFLGDQWYKRIKGGINPETEKFEQGFMPDAKVGRIQADVYDVEGADIVIGMLQSISAKDYPLSAFDSFGLVIIDECHCIPCRGFSRALRKINAPYMVGLTATPNRTDGMFKILQWYLGKLEYVMKEDTTKNTRNVEAYRYIYESNDTDYSKLIYNRIGGLDTTKMLGNLAGHKPRTSVICNKTFGLGLDGRNVMVMSVRRDHLAQMESNFMDRILYELMPLIEEPLKKTVNDATFDDTKTKVHLTKRVVSKGLRCEELEAVVSEYEMDREDLSSTIFSILLDKTIANGQDMAHKLDTQLDDGDEITFEQSDLDVRYGQLMEELVEFQNIKSESELVDYLDTLYENEKSEEKSIIEKRDAILYQLGREKKITKREYSILSVKNQNAAKVEKIMKKLSVETKNKLYDCEHFLKEVRDKLKPLRRIVANTKRRYNAAVRDIRDILAPIVKIHVYRAIRKTKGQLVRHPLTIRAGYYIGGMKESELQRSESCEIILATYQMASTGLDIPVLNTLVMATPKGPTSNVFKQAAWRIMRKVNPNFNPLLVDFCDLFGSYRDKALGRMRYYKRLKYPITTMVLDHDGNTKETFAEIVGAGGKKKKKNSPAKKKTDNRSRTTNLLKGKNIFGKGS